jgi:hypothetical protein
MRVTITIILLIATFLSYGQTKIKLKGQPTTLEETFIYLDNIFDDTSKYGFMTLPEDVATSRLHFGLGMWIRNNWGLWKGSKLKQYFLDKGIRNPDNMSGIILTSYHRYLNNKPIDLEGQIKNYQGWNQSSFSINDISRGNTTDSMLLTYFPVGDTILTSVSVTKKRFLNGTEGSSVTATAVVREHKKNKLIYQILTIENKPKWKSKKQVGDIQEESPYYCSPLPPKNWTIQKIK